MRSQSSLASRPRIAVVGAGFAGLTAARELGRQYAVTVLDGSPWFEWLPNTHELLSGVKRPADLRLPHRALVARAGHRFVQATVAAIDAQAGRLVTSGGRHIGFDACIVAVGGVHDTFGVPGADRHAMSFKGVDDCDAIGRRLAQLARRPGRHSVVIVGGGLEGIEALGEILRRFRKSDAFAVSVVEAGARRAAGHAAGARRGGARPLRGPRRPDPHALASNVRDGRPRSSRHRRDLAFRSHDVDWWVGAVAAAAGIGPRRRAGKLGARERVAAEPALRQRVRRGRCRGIAASARQAGLLRDADGGVRGRQRRPGARGPQAPQFQSVAQADAGRFR